MRKTIFLILLIFVMTSFGQENLFEKYKEIDGVEIKKAIVECNGNQVLTFSFRNDNSHSVKLSWYEEVWMDGICKQNGSGEENFRTLTLSANQIIEGDCDFRESFYIGSKIKRGKRFSLLTFFDFKNLIVENLN